MPPFSDDQVRTWAANTSLVSADWQARQDPNRKAEDPDQHRQQREAVVQPIFRAGRDQAVMAIAATSTRLSPAPGPTA